MTSLNPVLLLSSLSRDAGKFDLELTEVQSGGYLAEDDIVRFEDTYGRT